jgi:predicted nucleotidyltransferase
LAVEAAEVSAGAALAVGVVLEEVEASVASAEAVRAVAVQAAAGRKSEDAMVPEDKINEFLKRVREAAGSNLEAVILYGSAASGDFHPKYSNLNLFCVLRDSSFQVLEALAPVAKWWQRQRQPPPLCMTREELERSTDVFAIELLDMQQHHRTLFGEDVIQGLRIPLHLHRVQVEYELREKLILLREQLLLACGSNSRLWDLLLGSLPSFVTLFRHALIALGKTVPSGRREAVEALSREVGFDPSPINQVLNIREHKADPGKMDVKDLFARYLAAIEKVAAAVDRRLDSDRAAANFRS